MDFWSCPARRVSRSTAAAARARGQVRFPACLLISAGLLLALLGAAGCAESGGSPLVLAAASTVDALDAAIHQYRSKTGEEVRVSYGPTSTLARQIEAGAPADLFLAASQAWAQRVRDSGRVRRQRTLALNGLVVVEPGRDVEPGNPDPDPAHDRSLFPRARAPAGPGLADLDRARETVRAWSRDPTRRLAIADPTAVPAGIYAREALESLGAWTLIEPRLVPTVDVRAALALAARGEVDGAFVYRTDALSTDRVRVTVSLDPSLHGRIAYPLLLLGPARPRAERLWLWLLTEGGRRHFTERGFLEPDADIDP